MRSIIFSAVGDIAVAVEHVGSTSVPGLAAGPPEQPQRHLYVCIQGGTALQNHLALREYLRKNPDSPAKYGRLKKQLAARFPNDMDNYIDGKTDFVLGVLRDMGLSDHQLAAIDAVNRLKL